MGLALGSVKAAIASAVLPGMVGEALGDIRLLPHQREAAALLRERLERHRGAVLADPVGTGKTYTALACASHYAHVRIVAPAALRATWQRALAAVRRECPVISMEALSRARSKEGGEAGGLIIVDEAHHFRNPATHRYAALADLAWGRHLLLLTATPIHNAVRDVDALLALFTDPRTVPRAGLDEFVVRRRAPAPDGALPRLSSPRWLVNPADPGLLEGILALPAPVPLDDGGVARALGTLSLVRLWASSHAALAAALRRRRTAATAMRALVDSGEVATTRAVRACLGGEGLVQLPLGLLGSGAVAPRAWLATLERWSEALDELAMKVDRTVNTDDDRVARVLVCLARHDQVPAVLFTQSIDTARATYRHLAPRLACAGLWGGTTRVASGRANREEVLRLLRPGTPIDPRMPLQALVATDVVAEGVDLHAAGVLVHLDLPWTSARLAQRAGRLCRHGSPHDVVEQYGFPMPPCGEAHVRILHRLCHKAQLSRSALGIDPFPISFPDRRTRAAAGQTLEGIERLRHLVRSWSTKPTACRSGIEVAAVVVPEAAAAFVAVLDGMTGGSIVARHEGSMRTDPETIAWVLELAARGEEIEPPAEVTAVALLRIHRWMNDRHAREALHLTPGDEQHRVMRVIASLVAGAGRLQRARLLAMADEARRLVMNSGSAAGRQRLTAWLDRRIADPLESLRHLVRELEPGARREVSGSSAFIRAILLLTPGANADC